MWHLFSTSHQIILSQSCGRRVRQIDTTNYCVHSNFDLCTSLLMCVVCKKKFCRLNGAKCTNLTAFLSLLLLCHTTIKSFCSPFCSSSLFAPVFACSFSSPLIWCSLGLLLSFPLISYFPSPCTLFLPASDIQTLPRVYFLDSYATLQANGSDSRFLFSAVCHTHIPHSHLCSHQSIVYCLLSFRL